PAEQRDTEAAIKLWHRRATEVGGPPPLSTFDFSRLTSDWGYRFLISGDEFVKASVFLVYGVHFARLLGLPEQPRSKIPLVHQLPVRYRPLFVDGYGEALRDLAPARLSGTVVHQRKLELYRAAFMPRHEGCSVKLELALMNNCAAQSGWRKIPQRLAIPVHEQRSIPDWKLMD